ncbi:MAG: hypothetical protein A3D65_00070 [Candidatus Lloydbacteria bacterium RIFCSPHIGHO2_02_FULL_50_13]|uniref:Uncharacterized protein n=1 Tax=Candidatus Lloydbacteria bacterium RIFCSPHIGHO2_02_FULL_50_13 TaxID=1798661 RepID=A0A1G2DAX0_9BACT|nr:MAG: hypothetical protein A3D65_00070 [Candidatus Lloydbacteria bacterium RIFCSPHIGHO2_02_FULL_50_13]
MASFYLKKGKTKPRRTLWLAGACMHKMYTRVTQKSTTRRVNARIWLKIAPRVGERNQLIVEMEAWRSFGVATMVR